MYQYNWPTGFLVNLYIQIFISKLNYQKNEQKIISKIVNRTFNIEE